MSLSAIVLAGGASRRMGSPKALLPVDGTTFLRRIVGTLGAAGISDVVVVLGADAARIRPAMSWFEGTVLENHRWESGQLSSLQSGLAFLEGRAFDGALVWPVDHPMVGRDAIAGMVRAFASSGKGIVLPLHEGRRGHPVLFASRMFPRLRSAAPGGGARTVVRSHPGEICEVETFDAGVLRNIDTPEEFLHIGHAQLSG